MGLNLASLMYNLRVLSYFVLRMYPEHIAFVLIMLVITIIPLLVTVV